LIAGKIPDLEREILLALVQVEGSHFKLAIETLSSLNPEKLATEEVVMLYYAKGCALRGLERQKEALEMFQKVVSLESHIKREFYLVPYSLTEIGEIKMEMEEWKEAHKILLEAKKNYSGFDLDKPLIRRLENSLDKLGKMEKKTS
jgi:hypothetical protein